jgi:hypothetical protein
MNTVRTVVYPDTREQHNAKDFKIVYYDIVDERTARLVNTKCVEFTVVGRFGSEWKMGYPYNSFVFFNPWVASILDD